MIKVGILGSTGRVGSLLIDDLKNDKKQELQLFMFLIN
jgi:4-hydroxy-tetrahydrodipicolinate reductase